MTAGRLARAAWDRAAVADRLRTLAAARAERRRAARLRADGDADGADAADAAADRLRGPVGAPTGERAVDGRGRPADAAPAAAPAPDAYVRHWRAGPGRAE